MNLFPGWQEDVEADQIVVDTTEADLETEARENTWSFSLTTQQAQTLKTEEVIYFLEAVLAARERQIIERFGRQHPMIFYCWFDELAAQLRFSLVSTFHQRLPFGSSVTVVATMSDIVEPFLASSYHDGLPLEESEVVEFSAVETVGEKPLAVWAKQIP